MAVLAPSAPLTFPPDAGYDEARSAWNLAVDQRPAAVARPETAEDVVAAVRYAREHGLAVTAQGTGHGAPSLGPLDATVLIRTDRMRGVEIDAPNRIARVEAGAQWRDVITPAAEHGLACLHGSAPDVGVVGYTLGGGLSFYGRRYGTAANRLLAVELVTADGERIRADRREHRELFFALRCGGGGNFGIVTAMEFELFDPGPVQAGHLFFPLERAQEIVRAWACWAPCLPETAMSIARLLRTPDGPFAVIETIALGDAGEADALLAPLRALGPVRDTTRSTPFDELQHLHMDPPVPVPGVSDSDSVTLPTLPEAAADAFVAGFGLALLGAQIVCAGEKLSSLGDPFQVFAVGLAGPDVHGDLARMRAGLAPFAGGRRVANFVEAVDADPSELWDADTLARLRAVKAEVDPEGVIVSNHPLR